MVNQFKTNFINFLQCNQRLVDVGVILQVEHTYGKFSVSFFHISFRVTHYSMLRGDLPYSKKYSRIISFLSLKTETRTLLTDLFWETRNAFTVWIVL